MTTNIREKIKNEFEKDFFQAYEQLSFWKIDGKCKETQKHQTFDDWKKKKLIGVRTKSSYNKAVFRKSIGKRNVKRRSSHE